MIAMTIATIGRFMKKLAKSTKTFQPKIGLITKKIEVYQPPMTEAQWKRIAVWQPQRLEEPQ
jgi:hypothetical protein